MDRGDTRSDGVTLMQASSPGPSHGTDRDVLATPLHVLVIAGTDSSGGAGLIRDVQTISEFGGRVLCAITAVTAQTHSEVDTTCLLSPQVVSRQLRAALRSAPVKAIKIGMLGSGAILHAVLEGLPDRARVPIVVDPVLASSSGASLLDDDGMNLLRDRLLPRSTLVTPNLLEAATLLGRKIASSDAEQAEQAEELLRFGSEQVLLKGGHGSGREAVDVLVARSQAPLFLRAERMNATMRGTGCALSSAIAVLLASGNTMQSACEQAKTYLYNELCRRH